MATFNGKEFNSEVFEKYLRTVPRIKHNAFLKSGIFVNRQELAGLMKDQVGGNYITEPMTGLIGGDALNYDGDTDITATGIGSYTQGKIVVGRAKAWEEKDFTYDITGKDFMAEIAKQVAGYWDDIDQLTILAILEGIFKTTAGSFAEKHTLDLTEDESKVVDATTLNNAIQKASGANKNIFSLVIMHSQIATNLENMQLITYGKGVDANGVEKDLTMGTWNGRTVLIDDDVPYDTDTGNYTTYILGKGAFEYANIGAKVPSEIVRDALTDGGVDKLVTRQRKLFAPRGISFVQASPLIISPTDAQLKMAARWSVVKDADNKYLDHKAIPIARIISRG